MIRLGRPDPAKLRNLLDSCSKAEPTYAEVGATRYDLLPDDYHHERYGRFLGNDELAFDRGVEALRSWQAHLGSGIGVVPAGAPLSEGTNVVLVVPLPLGYFAAPCRVVYVVDEQDRFGFAYATLPGHNESGEEAFWVERDEEGTVVVRIVSFSNPKGFVARLGGPISRRVQRVFGYRYLDAINRYAGQ